LWLAISWWVDHHIDDTGHICHLKQQHSWSIPSHSDILNLCEWHFITYTISDLFLTAVFDLVIVKKQATHLILNSVVCRLFYSFHINHLQREMENQANGNTIFHQIIHTYFLHSFVMDSLDAWFMQGFVKTVHHGKYYCLSVKMKCFLQKKILMSYGVNC
jgi:hypothetical protein